MNDTKQNLARTLFVRKPWFIAAMVIGICGGVAAEVMLRLAASAVEPVATQWIKASPFVRKVIGDFQSAKTARTYTKGDWGFDGPHAGRQHYNVSGSKGDLDLLVYWEKVPGTTSPKIVKVQMIDTRGFDTIWP